VAEGRRSGLGTRTLEDGMTWLAMEAYAHPRTIGLFVDMLDAFGWWRNAFFRPFRRMERGLRALRRAGRLPWVARLLQHDVARNLRERADNDGGVLSGGEQQMLTMCRTLMGDPDLIMIDEPTEGLAPQLVEQVGNLLEEMANRGVSILLVEQKLAIAMRISKRVFVMGHGVIVYEGTPDELRANEQVRKEWLEV